MERKKTPPEYGESPCMTRCQCDGMDKLGNDIPGP